MDKNTIIGFLLIFGIIIAWQVTMAPNAADKAKQEQRLDSLRQVELARNDSLTHLQQPAAATAAPSSLDSAAQQQQLSRQQEEFGPFSPAASGSENLEVLENDLMRVTFSNKGGRIKEVELKKYFKIELDSAHKEHKIPLKLLEDAKNRFEYLLPVANVPGGAVNTGHLYFQARKEGANSIVFQAGAGQGRYFEQAYSLQPGSYGLQYQLRFNALENVLSHSSDAVQLQWVNYLDKLELNHKYERNYTTVYFKPADDSYDYCSCTANDEEDHSAQKMQWVAHSNQFFASILMAKEVPFKGAALATETLPAQDEDLKKLTSNIIIPIGQQDHFDMEMYLGPKDFEILAAYGTDLEDTVPFGRSILGSANRWVIRPLFNFLSSLFGSKGLAILLLTLLVKLALYPLTYKMLYSQSKMAALKPRLASLKEKLKDDQSQIQMETMKLYREFGVNPLGGCLPVVIQMPVWFALYRFFPASIEFRQVGFLWATDLSSYDTAFWLPWNLPFYGQHVSLFTLLWVVSTLVYTYYNMKVMDMSSMGGANATMMKYMQYLMPVFFLFFFNNFASGLTCYLVFSNVFNIGQTIITKNYLIDHDKIHAQMEAYRKKPKKKGGLQSRLEEAMKQQQAIAAQREAAAKTKGKKR
ncbi:MAG: membrane protein insertase YidC [Saprospiraceae bacterium]|nr:MAG: membrane protein insertase YidC [Saprospiraceae bacterium]